MAERVTATQIRKWKVEQDIKLEELFRDLRIIRSKQKKIILDHMIKIMNKAIGGNNE